MIISFTALLDEEMATLLQFAQQFSANPFAKAKFSPWDKTFYIRAFKEQQCSVDLDAIKQVWRN